MKRRQALKILALNTTGLLLNACNPTAAPTPQIAPTPQPPTLAPVLPTSLPPTPTITFPTSTPTAAVGNFFRLHPEIEAHPEAVFIKQTQVAAKTDDAAKLQEGRRLAQELFVFGTPSGIPLSHLIAIKANVTGTEGMGDTPQGMGIVTDKFFSEGLITGMKELGFRADQMYLREGNWLKDGYGADDLKVNGYPEVAQRTGIHLADFPTGRKITEMTLATLQPGSEVIWKDVPDGVVFKRIGYVAPYNQANTWLLNVAKLKAHGMGMTLCAKNLQGMCVSPHVHFCEGVNATLAHPAAVLKDFQAGLKEAVAKLHARHRAAGYPRWDRPGEDYNSGYGMEMWAQRTCDSLSVSPTGLNIVEGIYGRNGNGFMKGPGPKGEAEDFMTNLLIFGKDPLRVDIIATWLAGHEPGNFGLFHIAKERGLSNVVNPADIPVYRWNAGTPQSAALSSFQRTPLKTYYLQKNGEPYYHLVT